MRAALIGVGLLGATVFGLALLLSFVHPIAIERAAREVVRIEVERRVGAKVDELSNSKVAQLAQKALGKTDAEIAAAKQALSQDVPRKVADAVEKMLDPKCECRKRLAVARIKTAQEQHLGTLTRVRESVAGLIESAYASVTANLMREFRIFSGSNAVAFAALALVAFVRRGAWLQLLVPAVVLIGAVLITGSLYIFNQDWLHTVIYNDYVGFAYAGYLLAVAALLTDVLMNRARVTTHLLNALFSVVGVAFQAVPC